MNARERDSMLPAGFEDLEPHVAAWSLPTEEARYSKRISTSLEELRAFYDAIYPRMDAVMTHLCAYPAGGLAELPADTRRLYRLALAYFEASHPVELHWAGPEPAHAFPANRIAYQGPSCEEN
jgi:hypothetical protein